MASSAGKLISSTSIFVCKDRMIIRVERQLDQIDEEIYAMKDDGKNVVQKGVRRFFV